MFTITACSSSIYDDLSRTFQGEKVLEGEQLTDIFRHNDNHSNTPDFKIVRYKFEKEDI